MPFEGQPLVGQRNLGWTLDGGTDPPREVYFWGRGCAWYPLYNGLVQSWCLRSSKTGHSPAPCNKRHAVYCQISLACSVGLCMATLYILYHIVLVVSHSNTTLSYVKPTQPICSLCTCGEDGSKNGFTDWNAIWKAWWWVFIYMVGQI